MTTTTAGPRVRGRRPFPLWRGVLGTLLIVVGLSGVGYVVWDMFFNTHVDPAASQEKEAGLRDAWAHGRTPSASIPGNAIALMRIPAFGSDFEEPVLVGVDEKKSLAKGLGWYETTAPPGQIGNFAVAGHRGARGPFAPMLTLKAGDEVVVETREAIYTYALTNNPRDLTVKNVDTWVLDPVPGHPERQPTEALLTLTTCHDLFHSDNRAIAFGRLVQTQRK